MTSKFFTSYAVLLAVGVLIGAVYSRHGLRDLRRLQGQIDKTKERTVFIEVENQKLKRQVDLFEHPTEDLLERQTRDFLGWVKPNEIVYLEKSHRPLK